MMHIIIPNVMTDMGKWPFLSTSLGIIIDAGNLTADFNGSPCSGNCVLVAKTSTFQHEYQKWVRFLNETPEPIVIWNHFGGNDSGNYKISEINGNWERTRFGSIPRVAGISPIPYSMSANIPTPWDREISKLSADLKASCIEAIQKLAGRLDKLAIYAKAYYSDVGPLAIREVVSLVFPVMLLLMKYEGQDFLFSRIKTILEMPVEDKSAINRAVRLKVILANWTEGSWSNSGVDKKVYCGAVAFANEFIGLLDSQEFTNSERIQNIQRWFFSVSNLWDVYVQNRWFSLFPEILT